MNSHTKIGKESQTFVGSSLFTCNRSGQYTQQTHVLMSSVHNTDYTGQHNKMKRVKYTTEATREIHTHHNHIMRATNIIGIKCNIMHFLFNYAISVKAQASQSANIRKAKNLTHHFSCQNLYFSRNSPNANAKCCLLCKTKLNNMTFMTTLLQSKSSTCTYTHI